MNSQYGVFQLFKEFQIYRLADKSWLFHILTILNHFQNFYEVFYDSRKYFLC